MHHMSAAQLHTCRDNDASSVAGSCQEVMQLHTGCASYKQIAIATSGIHAGQCGMQLPAAACFVRGGAWLALTVGCNTTFCLCSLQHGGKQIPCC
jgi:hypothetical protein